MPLYDFICLRKATHAFEQVVPVGTEEVDCRFCKSKATRDPILRLHGFSGKAPKHAQGFKPSFYFRDAKGNIRLPIGDSYKPPRGFERVEMRTTSEIRKFEKSMNTAERAKYDSYLSAREARFNAILKQNRGDLRAAMQHMTPAQRDFARQAMEYTDNRQTRDPHFDAGFHIEAFSMDSSNREGYSDASTGWRRRKD